MGSDTKKPEPPKAETKPADQAKPTKPVKPAPTVEQLKEKWVGDIVKAQKDADKLDVERASAESVAKAAKKAHEAAVNRLQGLIRRGPSTQLELDLKDSPQKPLGDELREAQWKEKLTKTLIGDAIKLTPKQAELFSEAGVKSVMDFEDLRARKLKDYPDGLRSIKGIGDEAVTKLEDGMLAWYKANSPAPKPTADTKADAKPDAKETKPKGKKKAPAAV